MNENYGVVQEICPSPGGFVWCRRYGSDTRKGYKHLGDAAQLLPSIVTAAPRRG